MNKVISILAISTVTLLAGTSALSETQVVILGTGTPVPDHTRAGAGVAIVYESQAYIFDVGGGVVQRMIEASSHLDIPALFPTNIQHVFITHLHSDHMLDLVELVWTLWWRRTSQISVWGPAGLEVAAKGMYEMMNADVTIRSSSSPGSSPVVNPGFYRIIPTEIEEGTIFTNGGITIEAFTVAHGNISPAFGYRVTTPDKVIVISGDTSYSEKLVEMAKGADVLVHEVISNEGVSELSEDWRLYHSRSHTVTNELARVATEARPDLLVLYHVLFYGAPVETVLTEVQALYDGEVVLANDLDVF